VDRVSAVERSGNETPAEHDLLCPRCAAPPRLVITMLDPQKGKTVRVFECRCGKTISRD